MRTKLLQVIFLMLGFTASVNATDFFVRNANASGVDSFADAIAGVNAAGSGNHTITFTATVPVGSVIGSTDYTLFVIRNSNVTIDATGKNIIFRGATTPTVTYGLTIDNNANNITIKGLTFQNFTGTCIRLQNSSGVKILGCRFGTNATGSTGANTNISYGVHANGTSNVFIGGNTLADRNYFGDCSTAALYLLDCDQTVIVGNYFGISSTDALYAYPNTSSIYLGGCRNTTIGGRGPNQRNLFATPSTPANTNLIEISGLSNNNTRVIGNYFGYASDSTTEVGYANGILISDNANYNLIANNRFASTYSNPYTVKLGTTSYIGNQLRQNSFASHSGDPATGIMATNVTPPTIYSNSSTIIKGKANPGDSIEIYYANGYAKSGEFYIGRVIVPASGKWVFTGTFDVGKTIAVTATNNTNKTTSWFTSGAGIGSIYNCTNNANVSANATCKNAYLATTGYVLYGSVGTTTPANAGIWTSNGSGTFTNGALYNPSGSTRYIFSAADMANSNISFTLNTRDTNCVNTTSTGIITLVDLPVVNQGTDKFLCTNSTTITGTPAYTYNTWSSLDNPSNVNITNGGTNTASFTFNTSGSYRIQRQVMIIVGAAYCYNYDTMVVSYKPTAVPPTGLSLTTISQQPVSYTITGAPGEILNAYYYPGSAYPPAAGATVTSSASTLTYVSSGTFYGTASFSYTLSNQCGGTSMGTVSVNVQNAPPVAVERDPIPTIRKEDNTVVFYAPDYFTDVNNDVNPGSATVYISPASTAYCIPGPSPGYFTLDYTGTAKASDWVDIDSLYIIIYDGKPTPDTSIVRINRGRNLSDPADVDDIVVYEGISPDGDGVNDFLRIVNLSDYNNSVCIYNRWGDRVWEGENYNNTSVRFEGNGNVGNFNPLPNGTYFYVVKNKSRSDNKGKAGLSSGYVIISRPE